MKCNVRVRTGARRLGALSAVAAVAVAAVGVLPGQSVGSTGSGSGLNAAWDLRTGGVFSMSNSLDGNRIVAFARAGGTLRRVGSFRTGGRGSGGFEDTANGLVLGTARGESAPNNLIEESRLLFATNAGSNSISVFRVWRHRLELVEVQHSRGEKPVSITVNRGIAYVLNSGEFQNGLPTPPNCTTGRLPSVSGFRVGFTGQLTPIPHSRRLLSGDPFSGCAQVSFDPSGRVLVATERLAVTPGETPDDEGRINTWRVRANGTLGRHRVIDATGQGPFGFTFSKSGALLTTEQFDGPDGPHRGAAAGYQLNANGTLTRTSRSVHNGGTDTCWFVVTDDGRYGFTSSFFGTGRISSYRTGTNGSLRLLQARAADARVHQGASDLSLSGDSRYLYSLNSFEGTISVFRVRKGDLTLLQVVHAHRPSMTGAPIGLAAG